MGQRQGVGQGWVGHGHGLVPVTPAGVGALPRRWIRIGVFAHQEIPQIEVRVAECGLVHVEMQEERSGGGMLDGRPSSSMASRRAAMAGCLAGVDMAAGLHPDAQALVPVQHRPPWPDHDARRGDVRR